MRKKIVIMMMAVMFFAISVAEVTAQDVVMNSAETIDPGNFKLGFYPIMIIGKNGADSKWGFAGRAGAGLTKRIDVELKGALLKNLTYFGIDIEYWLLKGENFNVSAIGGWHMTNVEFGGDSSGFEATVLASTRPANKIEVYGGLRLMFDSLKNADYNYTLAHVVPGVEYKLSKTIDLLAEFGIALNDNSNSYLSFGVAYYIMR